MKTLQTLTNQDFIKICQGIYEDREVICRHNPLGTQEEILLWMLLSVLVSYLSLSEMETPCFVGRPTAETYRQAILQVLQKRMNPPFEPLAIINQYLTRD
jgi:hypothetical protein